MRAATSGPISDRHIHGELIGPRNVKRVACHRNFGPGGFAAAYQWALRMHGFEIAGRAEGAIGQSTDK
jgi:hypothetical protein